LRFGLHRRSRIRCPPAGRTAPTSGGAGQQGGRRDDRSSGGGLPPAEGAVGEAVGSSDGRFSGSVEAQVLEGRGPAADWRPGTRVRVTAATSARTSRSGSGPGRAFARLRPVGFGSGRGAASGWPPVSSGGLGTSQAGTRPATSLIRRWADCRGNKPARSGPVDVGHGDQIRRPRVEDPPAPGPPTARARGSMTRRALSGCRWSRRPRPSPFPRRPQPQDHRRSEGRALGASRLSVRRERPGGERRWRRPAVRRPAARAAPRSGAPEEKEAKAIQLGSSGERVQVPGRGTTWPGRHGSRSDDVVPLQHPRPGRDNRNECGRDDRKGHKHRARIPGEAARQDRAGV